MIKNLFLSSGLLLIFSGCQKKTDDMVIKLERTPGTPLIEVGGSTLSLEEVREDFLSRQGHFKGNELFNTDAKKKEFAEQTAVKEAMLKEAIADGFVNDVMLKRDIKELIVQRYMRDTLKKHQDSYKPTEEEIKKYYDEHQNLFIQQEALRVSYIKVPFEKQKSTSKKIATNIAEIAQKTVKNGNYAQFMKIGNDYAAKNTNAPTVESVHTGYVDKTDFEAQFGKGVFEQVFTLKDIGDISNALEGKDAYYIMLKKGMRKALNESLEDGREKIIRRLAFESRGKLYETMVADLKVKYNVKIHEEHLAELSTLGDNEAQAQNDENHDH